MSCKCAWMTCYQPHDGAALLIWHEGLEFFVRDLHIDFDFSFRVKAFRFVVVQTGDASMEVNGE